MQKFGRGSINQIHNSQNAITPIGYRNLRLKVQGSSNINMLVFSFSNDILLWGINT